MAAEASLPLALIRLWVFRVLDSGAVDGNVLLALDLQGRVVASDVDGITATSHRLATDGAVAEHKRVGVVAFDAETYCAIVAGTF